MKKGVVMGQEPIVVDKPEGWDFFWAYLILDPNEADPEAHEAVARRVRDRFRDNKALAADPTVAALRRLFKSVGCDPSRYRPSSEALLRRLVRGDALPRIHPLVDLNNAFSAELAVPCCVMRPDTFGSTLSLREGLEGESYESLRGPFKLSRKPVLVDEKGPVDTPITGNVKVKVEPESREAWLVAYLPTETVSQSEAARALADWAPRFGVRVRE